MNIILDTFVYPFRKSGKYMLFIGTILTLIAGLCSLAPGIGAFAYLFLVGYFCSTYFTIIQSSASGIDEAPSFPDVSNIIEDLIVPSLKILGISLVSFSPFFLYSLFVGSAEDFVADILVLLGSIYFPMAVLAVTVLGYNGAISPHIVIPAILKAGWIYWLAVILLYIIYALEVLITDLLGGSLIVGSIVMGFVSMYVLMASARVLGVVYHEREEELNWV